MPALGLPSRTEKAARERIHPVRKGLCSFAIAVALGAAVFLSRGDVAFGQTPGSTPSVDELRERIERLEKQNQELLKTLQGLQPAPRPAAPANEIDHESVSQQVDKESVQQIVENAFKKRDEEAKKAEAAKKAQAEAEGF